MRTFFFALAILAFAAFAAFADVVDKSPSGFTVRHIATVPGSPGSVYNAIVDVGSWWDSSHTWSGSAKNLSITAEAGGCFCERLPPDGELAHATVIYAAPGKLLRMSGALGPMQGSGVTGALTFELKPSGAGTEITLTYSAGGYFQGGIENLAGPVDQMLASQIAGLKKRLARP
ncbi:MAG: ATPase [Acidobacteriota bacterium]